ncbi:MAG: homocysteine S-methyltransferase family protein, partial [Lentisphaeria bacterium]
MKKPISHALRDQVLIFDGAMGTEIYKRHVFVNVCFDNLCITNPELVKEIHQAYYDAGADVLISNSFGANREKLREFGFANDMANINRNAAKLAAQVANSDENRTCYVAGDIGPFPWQHHSDHEIIDELKNQATALIEGGADFIIFESLASRRCIELANAAMNEIDAQFILSISLNNDFLSTNNESIDELMQPL